MAPWLLALMGIGAGVNAYATAQQIASQSRLLEQQASILRDNAKDNYSLATSLGDQKSRGVALTTRQPVIRR